MGRKKKGMKVEEGLRGEKRVNKAGVEQEGAVEQMWSKDKVYIYVTKYHHETHYYVWIIYANC